ncbi:MAG: histidinol-phosphate transaminase [Litorilinea sp.]
MSERQISEPSSNRHPQSWLRPEILALEPYHPIQPFEVLSARLGLDPTQIVKLDANENPYGPVPEVAEALAEYPYFHIYPDPQQTELRQALSEYCGAPTANILPSHGADEMLDYLCRMFIEPGDGIINCPPTFGMYKFDAQLVGAQVVEVWRRPDYSLDIEAIRQAVIAPRVDGDEPHTGRLKLLFITAPNNPTGNLVTDEELLALLDLPILVVLDEAYVEFAQMTSRTSWVLSHENLVVLRTFSKAAGIAGLRLGYGICPDWLMEQLWKFKQPYNVNVAATVAGLASLRNMERLRHVVQLLRQERDRLYALLHSVSYLRPYPSHANFVLCHVEGRDALKLKQELETQGVLVRHYQSKGLENCIRISVGRPEQTDRLMAVLHSLDTQAV